jgi:hypothetical protein
MKEQNYIKKYCYGIGKINRFIQKSGPCVRFLHILERNSVRLLLALVA